MHSKKRSLVISWFAISLLTLIGACSRNTKLVVEPINEELNHNFLTGERMDTNYFSTRDVMQYYQVSKYRGLPDHQILKQLDSFAIATYSSKKLDQLQKLSLLFYKKQMLVNYNDHLYESARDNDNRRLEGYADQLLAAIIFERIKENPKRMSYYRLLYDKNKLLIKAGDTILVK